MKTSLGIKDSERFGSTSPCCSPTGGKKGEKDPISFPEVNLCGSQIEAFGLEDAEAGDRFKVEIEFVVTRVEMNDDGENKTHRMGISLKDVTSTAEMVEGEDTTEDESEDEDPTAKYRKGPKPPKSVSPKDAGMKTEGYEEDDEES